MLQPTGSQRIRDHSANEQQTQLYSGVDTLLCTCSFSCNPYPPVCLPTDSKAPTLPIGCLPPILSPYHSQLCIVLPELRLQPFLLQQRKRAFSNSLSCRAQSLALPWPSWRACQSYLTSLNRTSFIFKSG